MTPLKEEDYKSELAAFEQRIKARRIAEKYSPWHIRSVMAHPRRTWRMAFGGGVITDAEWEGALAHMEDGTGNGSKKGK